MADPLGRALLARRDAEPPVVTVDAPPEALRRTASTTLRAIEADPSTFSLRLEAPGTAPFVPRTFHVETSEGGTYDGFFRDETADALVVRLAGGTDQVVPKKSVKIAGYIEGSSVMPAGLLDALTDEQVTNLVRYVQSLR